jgi:hypothetical protein
MGTTFAFKLLLNQLVGGIQRRRCRPDVEGRHPWWFVFPVLPADIMMACTMTTTYKALHVGFRGSDRDGHAPHGGR